MAPQKAAVMSGLQQIKGSSKEDVASKLLPEIIRIFRVFDALQDGDIQVSIISKILINRKRLLGFSSMFPAEHENKGEQ
jgi:hypothetical protein